MCTAQTAKRRRKQAVNGYRHMAPLKRPKYSKVDAGKARRKELAKVEKAKMMMGRKSSKK